MNLNRRKFIKKTAIGSSSNFISTLLYNKTGYSNIIGSSDRINAAVVGVRSRGKAHVKAIHGCDNAKILYNCDVDDIIIKEHNAWSEKNIGYIPKVEKDFIDNSNVDITVIIHGMIAIVGCINLSIKRGKND